MTTPPPFAPALAPAIGGALLLLLTVPGAAPVLAAAALAFAALAADRGDARMTLAASGVAAGLSVMALPALAVAAAWAAARRAGWRTLGIAPAALALGLAATMPAPEPPSPATAGLWTMLADPVIQGAIGLSLVLAAGIVAFAAARIGTLPPARHRLAFAFAGVAAVAIAVLPGAESRAISLMVLPLIAPALAPAGAHQRITALLVQGVAGAADAARMADPELLGTGASVALFAAGCLAVRAALGGAANDNPHLARSLPEWRMPGGGRHASRL